MRVTVSVRIGTNASTILLLGCRPLLRRFVAHVERREQADHGKRRRETFFHPFVLVQQRWHTYRTNGSCNRNGRGYSSPARRTDP